MIPKSFHKQLLIALVWLLLAPATQAQIFLREYLNTSTGFPHTDMVVVQDDRFSDLSSGSGIDFRDKEAYALVTLGLDPDLNVCHDQPIHYRVKIQSEETIISTPGSSTVQTNVYVLDVTYDPTLQTVETENAYIQVADARKLKLTIVEVKSVDANGTETIISSPSALPADLYVEGEIYRERYADFDPSLLSSIPTIVAPTGTEITQYQDDNVFLVKWLNVNGAAEYEIEWTYADDYGTGGYTSAKPTSQIPVWFKNNSSRVRVKPGATNLFFIPKIYAKGYVIIRIRAIGKGGIDLEDDIFGKWTLDNANVGTTLNLVPPNMYFVSTNQNSTGAGLPFNNLNAQYSIEFAEGGKFVASGKYASGVLRILQNSSAVKVKENEVYGKMAVITETIYDHMGRPAINTLPAVTKRGLWYTPNYNLNINGDKYSYKDFDTDAQLTGNTCNTGATPMNTSSGASQYYSPANPYTSEHHALIPDAAGYPFTQTIFDRDNKNQPKWQGEPGDYHRIGSGHETRFIYGGADQLQLNRLFGTDAGYASYYQKKLAQDENGQINVTYTDMMGHTVATALAGRVPDNLYALTDSLGDTLATSGEVVTEDLLGKSINYPNGASNSLSDDGRSYTMSRGLLITSEQNYVFSYQTELAALSDSCFPNLCMDCVYDLEVSLMDECGNYLIGNSNLDGPLLTQIGGQPLDTLCNDTTAFSLWSPDISVTLKPGLYMLYKKLSINEDALNFYLDKMMENSICLVDPDHFYELPDISGCEITCEDCLSNIGTWEDFFDEHKAEFNGDDVLAEQVLKQAYEALKADCEDLCTDRSRDLCANAYELMLLDMSLGGQYAEFDDDGTNITAGAYPVSYFNGSNLLPRKLSTQFNVPSASLSAIASVNNQIPTWRRPVLFDPSNTTQPYTIGYFDGSGTRVKVYIEMDVNGDYQPAVVNPGLVVAVDPANNQYYTYPENLLNTRDFVNNWQPSFAKSLVIYHPEFFQYEWCVTNYNFSVTLPLTSGSVTVNTFDFDQQLSDMNATQAASLFPASNVSQLFTAITNADPLFDNPHATTSYLMSLNALSMVQGKWNNFQFFPFPPLMMNIAQAAYATNHCGYNPYCSMPTNVWGPGGLLTADNDWKTFVDFYVSAKQNAMTVSENLYAHFGSPTNPTPWKRVSGQCIGSNSYFPIQEFISFVFSGGTVLYEENPCNPISFMHYKQKVRRFGLSSNQISEHYELSDPPSAAELQQYADQGYFQQTGNCPMARDLQILLNQLATNTTLTTGYIDLMAGPYLGSSLYNYLGSTANSSIGYSGSVSGSTLTATLSASVTCSDPFAITLPPDAVSLGYGFNDIMTIFNIENMAQIGSDYSFQVRAIVFNTGISAQPDTFLLSGISCLPLLGCQASFQSVCKPTQEAKDLMNLMSMLSQNNMLFNTTATNINAYSALLTPKLLFYLGSGGSYTWQYIASPATFILKNTSNSQAIQLDVSSLGLDPTKQYQFTTVAGPAVTTPSSGSSSQFTFTATELVPGSYNPLTNQSFGGTTAQMQGEVQMINFGQSFPITECDEIAPLECNTTEHQNRDDLQEVFELWVSMQGQGYTPQEFIDTCLTELQLASGNPFDITNISGIVSLEADMTQSQNTINSNYFVAVVSLAGGGTDTLTGYFCHPMRNCETCDEDSCRDITLIVQFPEDYTPTEGNYFGIKNLSDCIRLEQKAVAYNHPSPQAYWEDVATMLESLNPGVTAEAIGGVLYITFSADVYGETCPCDQPREYVLLDKGGKNLGTFTSGCCQVQPPCKDLVLDIPLPSDAALEQAGGFGIVRRDEQCINIKPDFYHIGSSLSTYWQEYAALINANTAGAHAVVSNGHLIITFDAAVYGETCPCEKGYTFALVNKDSRVVSTHTATCCTNTPPTPCEEGDAIFVFTLNESPHKNDVYKLGGEWDKCFKMNPTSFTYAHASMADFLIDVANQITSSSTDIYATASGNTITIRVLASALKDCKCSDRLDMVINQFQEGNLISQVIDYSDCCGSQSPPKSLEITGNGKTTRKNRRLEQAPIPIMEPTYQPVVKQLQEEEEVGPWEPWEELETPTDCHPEIVPFPPDTTQVNPCVQFLMETALVNAQFAYNEYLAQMREQYKQMYISRCMQVIETFERTYTDGEYHFTLYYYDRAGNLVKTVPPHAVTPLTGSDLAAVDAARDNGTVMVPEHNRALVSSVVPRSFALSSRYRYNTLELTIEKITPDGGKTQLYYDRVGRATLTQNANQRSLSTTGNNKYSYTRYDDLNRVTETGEMTHPLAATRVFLSGPFGTTYFTSYSYTTADVIQTLYDQNPTPPGGFVQDNLRTRIAYTRKKPKGENAFVFATYYSYDIQGNVKSTLAENKKTPVGLTLNQVDYQYDHITGKVLKMAYNEGKPDQYFHKYAYNDRNFITHAYTSRNNIRYDLDARYFYYRHEPLSRMELGQNKVQGMDYAYTIRGWAKFVNSDALQPGTDPGLDGYDDISNPNRYFARDAYGYSLNYFNNDYSPIGTLMAPPSPVLPAGYLTAEMWNSNVAAMNNTLKKPGSFTVHPLLQRYRHDQLNRLALGEALNDLNISYNLWNISPVALQEYANSYAYDGAGNLTSLNRNGNNIDSLEMDSLEYEYYPKTNLLRRVNDPVNTGYYTVDVDMQPVANYAYDPIGNLTQDLSEEIASIEWDVYGKVTKIIRTITSNKPDIEFMYSDLGKRIMKTILPKNGQPARTEFYVNDAQGNTLTIYSYVNHDGNETYHLHEQMIYGTNRLGGQNASLELLSYVPDAPVIHVTRRGDKRYELIDHLNNVHTVLTDRKKRICEDGAFTYYEADIRNTYDYYPFGMLMPGRSFVPEPPCSTITMAVIDTIYYGIFNTPADTAGWNGIDFGGIIVNAGQLEVAPTVANGGWGANMQAALDGGATYQISFNYTYTSTGACARPADIFFSIYGSSGVIFTANLGASSTSFSGSFTVPTTEPYTFQFEGPISNCSLRLLLDNVLITHTDSVPVTVCDSMPEYRFGFNGQEKDDEFKGRGNSLNFSFRMYDPRIARFFAVDPLAADYPWYTPYQFAGNMPIMAIDLEGLEPESVVIKVSRNRYKFTEPAIKLLSWASCVDEKSIRDIRIKKSAPIPFGIPYYLPNQGGGALTNKKMIRLTANYFDKTGKYEYTDKNGDTYNTSYGDNILQWLGLNAHEVGHIPQAQQYKTIIGYYISFIIEYAKAGNHDGAQREKEADQGSDKLVDFIYFTNAQYGKDALKNLFASKKSDEEKNKTLDEWTKAYDLQKQQEEEQKKQEDEGGGDK